MAGSMTAPTYDYVRLAADEQVSGRPFSDRSWNDADRSALIHMARRLNQLMADDSVEWMGTAPAELERVSSTDPYMRLIVSNPAPIKTSIEKHVVGFFGIRRAAADPTPIDDVDEALLAELRAFPEVLAYCTMQLADGNFGNLVILNDESARSQWREGTHHQYAVAELAPKYYSCVRLHNGLLRGGLSAEPRVLLIRTKYYNYENGFWCAIRELDESRSA
jgi:hypothetical protein